MYICIYVYMHICMYAYVYMCIHICISYMYKYICMYVVIYVANGGCSIANVCSPRIKSNRRTFVND